MGPTKMQEGPSARALSRAGPTLVFAEILTENGAPVRLVLDSSTTVDPITCGAKEALVLAMNRGVCVCGGLYITVGSEDAEVYWPQEWRGTPHVFVRELV
jgi:hypothetical protein